MSTNEDMRAERIAVSLEPIATSLERLVELLTVRLPERIRRSRGK